MKKTDVVIILGGGIDGTLTPILYTKERLETFVKMPRSFFALPVIVSGGYSASEKGKRPRYTEAEVMKNYLVAKGLSPKNIYLEKMSRDTIGNAYYSKQIVKRHPRWKNILVITTDGHVRRAKWIFKKIFGAKYSINYLKAPSIYFSSFKDPNRIEFENYVLNMYATIAKDVKDGDDILIMKLLKRFHPVYSRSKEARELEKEIVATKKRLLGYVDLQKEIKKSK